MSDPVQPPRFPRRNLQFFIGLLVGIFIKSVFICIGLLIAAAG
jgi:hypothetical protein